MRRSFFPPCLVPRPHFSSRPKLSGHVVHAKMFPARSLRVRHGNELTERDWENAVQGLGNFPPTFALCPKKERLIARYTKRSKRQEERQRWRLGYSQLFSLSKVANESRKISEVKLLDFTLNNRKTTLENIIETTFITYCYFSIFVQMDILNSPFFEISVQQVIVPTRKTNLNSQPIRGLFQNTHVPAKSCCISVNAEVSFLSRCSRVFLVSAFSCKRMRISSSTSKTWKEVLGQWEHVNFFYQPNEKTITRSFQLMTYARGWFEITSPITPELYDTKFYYQLRLKVTGPVSFIHFPFPVEAGQLTWSLFFHWFWLVIMCYVVKFHWLVAFVTWFSLAF